MSCAHFKGFSAGLFRFLLDLAENNNKEWFDEHRIDYQREVLGPVKAFVADLGNRIALVNGELDTEPRIGRTISRINTDSRLTKNRPRYRPYLYASFPRRGKRQASEALLYVGIYGHGVSVGFYPGGYREPLAGPVQRAVKDNLRLFQRYLDERRIPETYWELAGGGEAAVTKWPLPKSARRWVNLESFTVGEHFAASDPIISRRVFLDRAERILLDLYPLWLFASSANLKDDLELYREYTRPLRKAAV